MANKTKNVFISHHGRDDEQIGNLKNLLGKEGYTLRNSSIDSSKPNKANDPDYIKKILSSRIEWAGTTIVLIGPETHTREWVNWEIECSNKHGNRIVGIFIHGASDADVPTAFEKCGDALVGWQSEAAIDAIEGRNDSWENPDGTARESKHLAVRSNC